MSILLLGAFNKHGFAVTIGLIACASCLVWALVIPYSQEPTFGLAPTPFARLFTMLLSLTASITILFSVDKKQHLHLKGEEYPATILFALAGMSVVVAATNLLILFLGLEALSFAFYFLVAIDRKQDASAEAGLKYLLLGAVSAAFIAFGIALLYAGTGTLELIPAMRACGAANCDVVTIAGWGFILAGVAFKMSLAPFHLWTPDVFQGAPTPVTSFLATGSKTAAVALLLLLLPQMSDPTMLRVPLWGLSVLSMVVGNLAALLQKNIKRMLAYSSIAHMGYLTLALVTGTIDGFVAVAAYLIFYALMNLAAFGSLIILERHVASSEAERFKGLGYQRPFEAAILAIAMFSLAGIPPTVGFIGKFTIFMAAIRGGEVSLAITGILTAAVSAYYYLRIVVYLYMSGNAKEPAYNEEPSFLHVSALAMLGLCIIVFGMYPVPILEAASIIML
jgi:NADH-quinone oxidoreductase subunit N